MFTAVLPIGNWSNNRARARQERSDGVPARITVHTPEAGLSSPDRWNNRDTRRFFDPSAEKLTLA